MSLEELNDDITSQYSELDDELAVALDRETKNELAMLAAAFETDDRAELLRRGVHLLYRQTVESGDLDFHLDPAGVEGLAGEGDLGVERGEFAGNGGTRLLRDEAHATGLVIHVPGGRVGGVGTAGR